MNADIKALEDERTKIWFDTEFIEDGKTIELVSVGMIKVDGSSYYAEVAGVDYSRADPWLHENVFPHLIGGESLKDRSTIAADIIDFAGKSPEFWAYYADYDWVALCQLFGRMIDLPKGWPMYCRDLKQAADIARVSLPKQTTQEHNALADAEWTMLAYASLQTNSADALASAIAERDEARAELSDTFVDENGTTWKRPTAWAYYAVCKARDAHHAAQEAAEARLEEAKAVLGRITEHRMQDDTVLEAVRGLSIVQEMARAFLHQGGSE